RLQCPGAARKADRINRALGSLESLGRSGFRERHGLYGRKCTPERVEKVQMHMIQNCELKIAKLQKWRPAGSISDEGSGKSVKRRSSRKQALRNGSASRRATSTRSRTISGPSQPPFSFCWRSASELISVRYRRTTAIVSSRC